MYNLNVSGSGGSGMLSLPLPQGENSTTPRTPEILNSLIAMSNPFDSSYRAHAPRLASSPPGNSDISNSSSGSGGCVSPPSVQSTCSQLIKEGLKLTIQSKRRQSHRGEGDLTQKIPRLSDEVSGDGTGDESHDGLTPEDEERRRRRRERNKIAATKCRLKKRERTVNLVQESEILENQNHDLKSQIQELETQRRRLVDMLSVHRPNCTKPHAFPITNYPTTPGTFRRVDSYPRPVMETNVTYRRVETCVEPYQRMESVLEETYSVHPRCPTDAVYHNFEEKENPLVFNRQCASDNPTFGDQYCQNLTHMDQFVKPEMPSVLMSGFQSPASFRPSPLDMNSAVSPGYDSGTSPSIASSYQQFDEESDTFSGDFSPAGLDRSCMA